MPSDCLGKRALKYRDSSFSSRSTALILLWQLPGVKVTSPPDHKCSREERSQFNLHLLPPASPKVSCALNQIQGVTGFVQPTPQARHLAHVSTCDSELQKYRLLLRLSMWPEPWTGWRCSVPLAPPSRGCTLALPGVTRAQCPRVREPSRPTSWGPVLSGR